MSTIQLRNINIFPVKSLGGVSLSHAFVGFSGLAFDRRFMLSDPEGGLLSARKAPALLKYQTLLREDGIEIISPTGEHIRVRYPELFENYRQVSVWGSEINAQHCGEQFDEWFSQRLERPCQLLYFGQQSQRQVVGWPETPVAFADGYPLLLTSTGSLAELNKRSAEAVTMAHFRANLVIDNDQAFAEDGWKHIRIGEIEFVVAEPCARCVMTTYNPKTGEKTAAGEPLKTLAKFRKDQNGIYFGQNLIALNEGQIKQGDKVEVLETQTPVTYADLC